MNFLKKLFGGDRPSRDGGYYVYVKPKMCQEIVRVRINLMNDLSLTDDNEGYWVRKMASATRCPFNAELTLHFNKNKQLVDKEIVNGEYVDEAVYQEFLSANSLAETET
jgi:hypothetical protein